MIWEDGMVPFPDLEKPFPGGVSAGLDPPDTDLVEAAQAMGGRTVGTLYKLDLTRAGVAINEGDVQVCVGLRTDREGVCLLVMEAQKVMDSDCAPDEQALRWPFLVSVATTDGRWAAVVADGWDTLQLPSGETIEETGNVLWLDGTAAEVPETAILIGSDRQAPVALRRAVEASRSEFD